MCQAIGTNGIKTSGVALLSPSSTQPLHWRNVAGPADGVWVTIPVNANLQH